jgi:hypothetical protein
MKSIIAFLVHRQLKLFQLTFQCSELFYFIMKILHFIFCWSQLRSSKLRWLSFPTAPVLRMYRLQESDRRGGIPNVLPSEEVVSRMAFTQQCHVGTKWRLLYGRRIWQLHHHHTGSSYWLPLWRAEKWQKNGESSKPMHFCWHRMEFCTLTNHFSLLSFQPEGGDISTLRNSVGFLASDVGCLIWDKAITIHW